MRLHVAAFSLSFFLRVSAGAGAQVPVPPAGAQNPSPMVEHTRAHERLEPRELPGSRRSFAGPLGKPVDVFVPDGVRGSRPIRLVIEFHGSPFIPDYAVSRLRENSVAAVVSLAPGSGVYDRTFRDPAAFDTLVASIRREVGDVLGRVADVGSVTLVGYSAGHGAVRAILRDSTHFARIDAVLLLDGLHTSYVPEGTVLEKGGALDTTNLVAFERFAREALRGKKRFLITHSEIFPARSPARRRRRTGSCRRSGFVGHPWCAGGRGGCNSSARCTRADSRSWASPATRRPITSISSRRYQRCSSDSGGADRPRGIRYGAVSVAAPGAPTGPYVRAVPGHPAGRLTVANVPLREP